jgi:drug/metabolite transporter (DMT)-like permease
VGVGMHPNIVATLAAAPDFAHNPRVQNPLSDRRVVLALALICCFLWGSAVPGVKIGYQLLAIAPSDTPSLLLFAGLRFTLAGGLLLALALVTRRPVGLTLGTLGEVGLLGLVSTAGQYLFYYVGLAHTTGVKVSITTSSSTFFSAILAHWLYANDKLTPRRLLGCLIGFAGVVVVNLSGAGFDFSFAPLGEGFILIAAVMFSAAGIFGKRVSRHLDVLVMTGWQLGLGGLMLTTAGLATGGHLAAFTMEASLLLVYLGALSAAAFSLWALLLKHNPVGSIAIFNCLIPVFGVTLSGIVLGEAWLEWKNLAALGLVSVGIWLATAVGRKTT